MFSHHWRTGTTATMVYFDHHLATGDYYLGESQEIDHIAEWLGQGASRLGLSGSVTRDQFEALTHNLNPATGEKITARMNEEDNRRTWWDVALSPPKDVSVFAALADAETKARIEAIHYEASKKAAAEMETFLGTRVRAGNSNESKLGNCEAVIAAVLHDTARPVEGVPDPHLHTHLLFANCVFDRDRDKWLALQNSGVLSAQKYVRQFYYSELVRGLNALGIETETREMHNDFIIAGMERGLVDAFSRRHDQVESRAKEKEARGMLNSAEAKHLAVVDGREKKVDLSPAQLREEWEKIAGKARLSNFSDLAAKTSSLTPPLPDHARRHLTLDEALHHVYDHSFENFSVLKKHELYADILKVSRGKATVKEIDEALEKSTQFLTNGNGEFTTKSVLLEELSMIVMVNRNVENYEPLKRQSYNVPNSPEGEKWEYSAEQKATISAVLNNRDFVFAINGTAGAGKTTLLKEIEKGLEPGTNLVPLAPSGQATGVLRSEGFHKADTLQQWLVNTKMRESTAGSLLVVDEAGLISVPAMQDLLSKARQNNNRVLLVGDTRQINSVGRGDSFRLLQERSKLKVAHVEETRRQTTKAYKSVVTAFRHAATRKQWSTAWDRFEAMDAIKEITHDQPDLRSGFLLKAVADSYTQEKMIVGARWETIHSVNSSIREKLQSDGKLGNIKHIKIVLEPINLTQAEIRRGASYEIGQVLELVRNASGIGAKDERFRIHSVSNGSLTLANERGREITVQAKSQGKHFRVFKERSIDIRDGDTLLIKKNWSGLKNGERVKVQSIAENGEIITQGKNGIIKLNPEFQHFLHGYAVTAHSSQGATVDHVLVMPDGMTREQFYVAATRGKKGLEVLTNDAEQFKDRVKISSQRTAASEAGFTLQKPSDIAKAQKLSAFANLPKKTRSLAERLRNFSKEMDLHRRTVQQWLNHKTKSIQTLWKNESKEIKRTQRR